MVSPFCLEKTRMMNAESLISDNVIWSGIVRLDAAANGCGDVKPGFADRHVFRGFAYVDILAMLYSHTD
jgi:hypothetical protein